MPVVQRTQCLEEPVGRFRNLFVAVMLAILALASSGASDIYIAQTATGGNTGLDCADAYAYTFFNTSANWGTGAGQIGPGTTVHLCGTFTAPANANGYLTFQGGSGTSGNPITLRFEPGAVLTAPVWGPDGAIFAGGSYIVIDGGTNGIIEATANGTGLTYSSAATAGVYLQGLSNSEVKNLTIENIYVQTVDLADTADGTATWGINWNTGSNITIDHNTIHDAGTAIRYSYAGGTTSSGVNIFSNTTYNINWGVIVGDGNANAILNAPVTIHDNVIHDFVLWDQSNNSNHHDGIYCFATDSGSSLTSCQIYNNYIYGDPGTHGNTFIFASQNTGGMSCSGVQIFNNVLANTSASDEPANGLVQDWCTNTLVVNNTFVGNSNANLSPQPTAISINPGVVTTVENNIFSMFYHAIYIANSGTATMAAANNNDFYNVAIVGSDNAGNYYNTLANWQACTTNGCPANHDTQSSIGNPNLAASYQLGGGSAASQTAMNLSSLGILSLDADKNGVARPPTGAGNWDMGAYADSITAPAPATGLTATVT